MIEAFSTSPILLEDAYDALPEGEGARLADLCEITSILRSPVSKLPISIAGEELKDEEGASFPIVGRRPILYPHSVLQYYRDDEAPVPLQATFNDALLQYIYLAQVKAQGWAANSAPDDPWFFRHVWRSRDLLKNAAGLVLDIGCDDPLMSKRAFPEHVSYVGLEPSLASQTTFSIAGMAEFLPFADGAFDGVSLLTSLDHILDYHAAIDEAFRVLKPGGMLFLASLIWASNAQLTKDNIHFHHFRDFEISGALRNFEIVYCKRYVWKTGSHRYGAYIGARKAAIQE